MREHVIPFDDACHDHQRQHQQRDSCGINQLAAEDPEAEGEQRYPGKVPTFKNALIVTSVVEISGFCIAMRIPKGTGCKW